MNYLRSVLNGVKLLAPKLLEAGQPNGFHTLNRVPLVAQLVAPNLLNLVQSRDFKLKVKLRRRCRDCYMVRRQERTYVLCPTHPRHKQMSMVKKPKYTWILTHATQSKIRPY